MRVHASMTNARSGTMGMYTATVSPFLTPWKVSTLATRHTSASTCAYV